jgi:hypothetical protein
MMGCRFSLVAQSHRVANRGILVSGASEGESIALRDRVRTVMAVPSVTSGNGSLAVSRICCCIRRCTPGSCRAMSKGNEVMNRKAVQAGPRPAPTLLRQRTHLARRSSRFLSFNYPPTVLSRSASFADQDDITAHGQSSRSGFNEASRSARLLLLSNHRKMRRPHTERI